MKTIIHIGQHKTGTTSIQHFLQDKRKVLAQHGLFVPTEVAGYSNPSHFILNVYALEEGRFSRMKEKIIANQGIEYLSKLKIKLKNNIEHIYNEALKKRCNRVIWSNEGLYLLNTKNEYTRLIDLFTGHSTELEVVCCFRDVEGYRNSYKKQLAKQNIPLSDNPDSYRYLDPDSWLFDYQRKKDLLSQVFDKCTYFSYDPEDNLSKFIEAIGIKKIKTDDYRLNVTKNSHTK